MQSLVAGAVEMRSLGHGRHQVVHARQASLVCRLATSSVLSKSSSSYVLDATLSCLTPGAVGHMSAALQDPAPQVRQCCSLLQACLPELKQVSILL